MSYLDSFYYPYYSARHDPPPALATRLTHHPLEAYARPVAVAAEVEREIDHRIMREEAEARLRELQAQDLQHQYYDRIAALRRERDMLDINQAGGMGGGKVVNSMLAPQDEKMITDEQLIQYYQNGERKQQYADELKASHSPKPESKSPLTKIIKVQQRQAKEQINSRGKSQRQKQQGEVRRSYVDTLKTSKHYDQKHNVFLNSPERGHTLDMYQVQSKNQRRAHKSKSRRRAKSNRVINRSVTPLKGIALAPQAAQPAIQRINNRVKLSQIIYIDSKLRNRRHQVDHLLNTYQCEGRLRKQVKEKINNHPDTLKKHKMVAQSR